MRWCCRRGCVDVDDDDGVVDVGDAGVLEVVVVVVVVVAGEVGEFVVFVVSLLLFGSFVATALLMRAKNDGFSPLADDIVQSRRDLNQFSFIK